MGKGGGSIVPQTCLVATKAGSQSVDVIHIENTPFSIVRKFILISPNVILGTCGLIVKDSYIQEK